MVQRQRHVFSEKFFGSAGTFQPLPVFFPHAHCFLLHLKNSIISISYFEIAFLSQKADVTHGDRRNRLRNFLIRSSLRDVGPRIPRTLKGSVIKILSKGCHASQLVSNLNYLGQGPVKTQVHVAIDYGCDSNNSKVSLLAPKNEGRVISDI